MRGRPIMWCAQARALRSARPGRPRRSPCATPAGRRSARRARGRRRPRLFLVAAQSSGTALRRALAKCRFERGDRFLQGSGVPGHLAQRRQRAAHIILQHGPVERHALAREFEHGGLVGGDRLLQHWPGSCSRTPSICSALARLFSVVCPVERRAFAGPLDERRLEGAESPRGSHQTPADARRAPAAPHRDCSGWSPIGRAPSPA